MSVLLEGKSWTQKVTALEQKVARLEAQVRQALRRVTALERKQGVAPPPRSAGDTGNAGEEDVQCRVC